MTARSRRAVLDIYRRHYNHSLSLMMRAGRLPIEVSAREHTIVDERGREYLDFSAGYGVFGLGHLDPDVQRAAQRQLAELAMVPPPLRTAAAEELKRTLARITPGDLEHVILSGSGSEAVEVARRLARLARPGRVRMVAATTGYHGKTLGAMALLGQNHLTAPFFDADPDTRFVPYGDLRAMAAALDDGVAAVCLEPVVGGGYVTVPPDGYLTEVARLCRWHGALLIADEVQTGFGRTGTLFGVDRENVAPDILVVSKAMSGGHVPISATVVRDEVFAAALETSGGALPFDTEAGWSPFVCAAAAAAMEKIVADDLAGNAARLGDYLLDRLASVAARYPSLVLEVEGRGLMVGMKVLNPLVEQGILLQMVRRGVLTGISMNSAAKHPALRIFPPLTVSRAEIDKAVAALDATLADLSQYPAFSYRILDTFMAVQFHLPRWLLRYGADILSARRGIVRTRPWTPAFVAD
ncbi:aspartate aminotransferase family protein [Nocardia puris]|uniref:Diamine aminotransferase n=1 Tax=Nocardia puris TaxID=208602 RepID=A0A366DT24_9NOCA|nr:aminotransferase class III-fold pyridoxal phosphate-dependent enzyme [Nocardia puris]RBO92414.1 diamine aminotransferase [Nocardia puris]